MKRSRELKTIFMMPDYRQDNPYQALLAEALEELGYRVLFPGNYRRVFPLFRSTRSNECDILHLHWLTPYLKGASSSVRLIYTLKLALDLMLVRARGVQIVWTVHNVISHDTPYGRTELWINRFLARIAMRLIAHSHTAEQLITSAYRVPPDRIAVIPHGHFRSCYGMAAARRQARERLEIPRNARVFVNVGMLRPYKGIENLLEAWRRHRVSHPNDFLLIAGQPLDENYLTSLTELSEAVPGVELRPGYVSDEEIPDYMSAADVVVLPFRRILTSGSLILAMSYGKPVIAPDLPTVRETLGSATDLLFEPDNRMALTRALSKVDEVDLDALQQKTIEACDHLDWRQIGLLTDAVYRNVRSLRHAVDVSPRVKRKTIRTAELNR